MTMAIFTDPHYYDPALGTTSDAFAEYMVNDRKLVPESKAILEATVSLINAEDVEVVLVPGDLTKDGEKQCHEQVADYLAQIEATGKKVYVVPGNHDIDNPHAYSYPDGSDPVAIPTITPAEFRQIYLDYGYDEAIAEDPASLSYIARPKDGIWILGMDVCNYNDKFADLSKTGGAFSEATLNWVLEKLEEAKEKNITVIGMMHHGIVEHFPGMRNVFSDYLVKDWETICTDLAEAGLKLVFTGHHHATDIAKAEGDDGFIVDVQTGSTVTWTCPYRIISLDGTSQIVNIDNRVITEINYDTQGLDFQTYAQQFLMAGLPSLVVEELQKLGVDEAGAMQIEPIVTPTFAMYYHGDEPLAQDPAIMAAISQMLTDPDIMTQILGMMLDGIWNDDTPDSDVLINLKTGEITAQSGNVL